MTGVRAAVAGVLAAAVLAATPPLRGQTPAGEPPPIAAGRAAPAGTYGDLDVLHYDVTLGLPGPGGTVVEGDATLTLRVAQEGVERAVLDLTGLAVTRVQVDGVEVAARLEGGRLSVPLPAGATPADTFALRIRYRGTPDDGLILGPNVHGRPSAFVDNWPNRTRFWMPSVDHPSDKATAALTVHAPEGWRVVANGVPVGVGEAGPPAPDGSPRRTWRWRMDTAVSAYNLVLGAAEMDVVPLGLAACGKAPAAPRADGCVEVSAWLFAEDAGQARRSFRRAPEMVDFYTRLVGPYPFPKLAHVQAATRFGGMENASAIFYSEGALASGRDMEGTVAHETAHQWFGDHVTQVDWPELWLSEGFATYFGHLFFEDAEGPGDFRRRMLQDREEVLASPDVRRPVIDREEQDLFALLNDNNYPKAGWVLHMLRGLMGDEAFFRGIRGYYSAFAGRTATTDDFRRVMEAAAGRDLGWYFRQWLEEPGYPILAASTTRDETTGEVVLTVRQRQEAGWPTFRIPLEVELAGERGAVSRHAVEVTEREQSFRLPGPEGRVGVTLDPEGWVLFRASR